MKKIPPQQLILEAVITCIEKYGVGKTTTRKIAEEAGTNIAAINYYFRSKDDLIAQALGVTLQNMKEDLQAIVEEEDQPFEVVLRKWMAYLVQGAQQYPGVFMAHMYAPLLEKRYDTPVLEVFRALLAALEKRAQRAYPQAEETDLHFALIEVVSALIFRLLTPGMFNGFEEEGASALAERYARLFERAVSHKPGV